MKKDSIVTLVIFTLVAILVMSAGAGADIQLKEKLQSRQWLENGRFHYDRGEFRKAMECFEKSLMIDRNNVDAETMLNTVLEEVLEKVRAEQDTAKNPKVLVAKPVGDSSQLSAGTLPVMPKRPRYVKERTTMEKELKYMREMNLREGLGEKTQFKLLKGYLRNTGKKPQPEKSAVESLVTGNADYHSKLGVKYAKAGNYEKAIEEFRTVLTIDPGNMFARMNLGLCLAYSDHLYEAVKEYKKVLELAPDGSKYASTAKKMLVKIKDLI